ncbi:MAG TPA: cupin domain-containing protein, partial [Methanomicrobia archaeon]|nr:cupin domain-containing protein [Methanomicrobia archaeon]
YEGDEIPHCRMKESVLFYVMEGTVTITVDGTDSTLKAGQCLITHPATLSMRAHTRTRIMGVQVPAPGGTR